MMMVTAVLTSASAMAQVTPMVLGEKHAMLRVEQPSKYLLLPVQETEDIAAIAVVNGKNEMVQRINVKLAVDRVDYYVPYELKDAQLLDIEFHGDRRLKGAVGEFACWKEIKYSDTFDTTNRERFRLAQNPPVLQTLRAHGYTIGIQVSHDITAPFYPRALLMPNATGGFLCACIAALQMSPIGPYEWFRPFYCRAFRGKFQAMLQSLCNPHPQSPFLHYLHIMCPHPPFVFAGGANHDSSDLFAHNGLPPEQIPAARANIAGIDAMVLPVLRQIIEKEKSHPPIIILHSDHGMGRSLDNIESVYGNLLALYIPDPWKPHAKNLHFINLYRFILNHLFDMHLPYHKDNDQKITLEEYLKYGK